MKYEVYLEEYNPNWINIYETERLIIMNIVGEMVFDIYHFGSTSIPNMVSKPTVDILIILKENVDLFEFARKMISVGYICTKYPKENENRKNCMNFIVEEIVNGTKQRKCLIHIREFDVPYPEILFARYLRENKNIAQEYIELKKQLANEFRYDKEAYMTAKNEFIREYTNIAINLYK